MIPCCAHGRGFAVQLLLASCFRKTTFRVGQYYALRMMSNRRPFATKQSPCPAAGPATFFHLCPYTHHFQERRVSVSILNRRYSPSYGRRHLCVPSTEIPLWYAAVEEIVRLPITGRQFCSRKAWLIRPEPYGEEYGRICIP